MEDRGFGLELEKTYGEMIDKADFQPRFWNNAESVSFKLNDEPVTKAGSSRMNRRVRAGVMKPTGSTSADADLEQLIWYFIGFLDNYQFNTVREGVEHPLYRHEFWGGENKRLQSYRGIAVYDMFKQYIYGLLLNNLKLDVSNDSMSVDADWIYKTEKAGIIGNGDDWERPDELYMEQIFIMFYDVSLFLNQKDLDGISTAFSFEGGNNLDVDHTIGMGSRYPQKIANATNRENKLKITTTLTEDTVRSILDARYGEVGALEPSACKLLQLPLEIRIEHCEDIDIYARIVFPRCTLSVDFDMSNVDVIEATISLETLGSDTIMLADGTEVTTDMYVEVVNYQPELSPDIVPENELTITVYDTNGYTVPGANVSLVGSETTEKVTDRNGKVQFKVDYGDYTATVSKEGYNPATKDISFNEDSKKFTVTLEPISKPRLRLIVEDENDDPVEDATVTAEN